MGKWYRDFGPEGDVVLSTRIRFARNIKEYPFPFRLDEDKKKELNSRIKDAILSDNENMSFIEMESVPAFQTVSLAERHLISPEFAGPSKAKALILSDEEDISIMLQEEDHLRIQAMEAGLNLEKAYEKAEKIEKDIGMVLNYAFDERIGFLTQCPTNLGTGMRASVMLHLPALTKRGLISKLSSTVSKLGLVIRGAFGEGSQPGGDIYQVSNQITLGISEKEAIFNLDSIVKQIISQERNARKELIENEDYLDSIFRAYGILKYARKLTSNEFMKLISLVRLAVAEKIIDIDIEKINAMIPDMQPATVNVRNSAILDAEERDKLRAKEVREILE
ncbi:MAG: protein arginine kinase [Ruminococcaceae bacterium]|nr:protein arginine kinase [Oscillospiraceae bacterium]